MSPYMGRLPEVKDEGRWVLVTETVFNEAIRAIEGQRGASVSVDWHEAETRDVTLYTPTVTVSHEATSLRAVVQHEDSIAL